MIQTGSCLLVDGVLETSKFVDKNQIQRTSIRVLANFITLVGSRQDQAGVDEGEAAK